MRSFLAIVIPVLVLLVLVIEQDMNPGVHGTNRGDAGQILRSAPWVTGIILTGPFASITIRSESADALVVATWIAFCVLAVALSRRLNGYLTCLPLAVVMTTWLGIGYFFFLHGVVPNLD